MQNKKQNRKPWPMDCPWPEPLYDGHGEDWSEDWPDPDTLDEGAASLLETKEYFDSLVDEGLLNEDYTLNEDYFEDEDEDSEDWEPEKGLEFWEDGRFDLDAWGDEFSFAVNLLKIGFEKGDPAGQVRNAIGYEFINENLLRQAFTRRAFALEYGLRGCSEELEFLGDAILNQVVSKELIRQLSDVETAQTDAPLRLEQGVTEGVLSKLRSEYVCKEQLAKRAQALGLDQLILYGTGEAPSDSSREDAMEALIGAVAIDSGWNRDAIEGVVDKIICVQKEKLHNREETSYYDRFNAWHQKRFGVMPEYEVSGMAPKYYCTMRYFIPENDQDLWRDRREDTDADSRSAAREWAARRAYEFVVSHGLWTDPADVNVAPRMEDAINQLQELYQKKILAELPSYSFRQISPEEWQCVCKCGNLVTMGFELGKTKAKKAAAYDMLYFIQGSRSIVVDPKTGATDDKKYATKILRAINIQSLYKISNYKKNWDREGALPFSIKLIRDIYYVLKKLDEPPAVGPLGEGNIQLEFYHSKSGYYLEVEFVPNGLIYCHSYIEGQKETRRCEMDDIPAFVSEWLKQREAYFAGKKNQGTAEKMKP